MDFRSTTQADIDYMKTHSFEPEFYKGAEDIQNDYIYTLYDEGDVLAIGGIRMMNKTTCIIWIDLSKNGIERSRHVWRTIVEWTEGYIDSDGNYCPGFYEFMGIVRVEAYVKEGFEAGLRFVKHLGMKYDRVVDNYLGKDNAVLYVKLFERNIA